VTLGLAEEFRSRGVAVNALWPRTVIATDALKMIPGVDVSRSRRPEIVADAAHAVLTTPAREMTGRFLIDEEMLRSRGVEDFTRYAVDPARPPLLDLFVRDAAA
jgi:citronellol/citronellal dehydrogenase